MATICYPMKADTDQLNLRPSKALIAKLENLASKFKGDSKKRTEIAVEILEFYADHWEKAEELKRSLIAKQLNSLSSRNAAEPDFDTDNVEQIKPTRSKQKKVS